MSSSCTYRIIQSQVATHGPGQGIFEGRNTFIVIVFSVISTKSAYALRISMPPPMLLTLFAPVYAISVLIAYATTLSWFLCVTTYTSNNSLNSRDILSRQLAPASTLNIVDGRIDMSDFRLRSTRQGPVGRDYDVRALDFSNSLLYSPSL